MPLTNLLVQKSVDGVPALSLKNLTLQTIFSTDLPFLIP